MIHASVDFVAQWPLVLAEIRRVLPLQNPLGTFVHNNMLMAWEDFPFWEGVAKASDLYGARLSRSLDQLVANRQRNLISGTALRQAIAETQELDPAVVEWLAALMELRAQIPSDTLLSVIDESRKTSAPPVVSLKIFGDATLEWLCKFLEATIDQGVAHWRHPAQTDGLLPFFYAWIDRSSLSMFSWQTELIRQRQQLPSSAQAYILSTWKATDCSVAEWRQICLRLLFHVKGWAGMVNKAETEPTIFCLRSTAAKLEDLLVILLLIARAKKISLKSLSLPLGVKKACASSYTWNLDALETALRRLSITTVDTPSHQELAGLAEALQLFDHDRTIRVWQTAFELTLHGRALSLIRSYAISRTENNSCRPSFQMLCCMDDREESLRRHLEKADPHCETYGVLGNFGIDMLFAGLYYSRPRQHCPPVIIPRRTIVERATARTEGTVARIHQICARLFKGSRTLVRGSLATFLLGPIAGAVVALWPSGWEPPQPSSSSRFQRFLPCDSKSAPVLGP